jgi:hypothetical protein
MSQAQGSRSDASAKAASSAHDSAQVAFAKLRQTACRELTSVTARLAQKYSQAAADYRRTLTAAHTEAQAAHEGVARDYMESMQAPAGADASDIAQRCNNAIDEVRKIAQTRAETGAEEARRAVDQSIVEANAAWDAACASYIGALQKRVGEIDPAAPDPLALAAAAEGLGWIALRVKRRDSR